MIRNARSLVLLVFSLSLACGEPPAPVTAGPWPVDVVDEKPDVIDIVIADDVVVTPPELVDEVIVEPDALVFAADQLEAVEAAFPVGAPVVGGRAEGVTANSGNPLGFLRRVTAIRVEADAVIVDTEPAKLTDIMIGTVSQTFDPVDSLPIEHGDAPIESFFPRPTPENGGDNTGEAGGFIVFEGDITTPAITLSLDGTIKDIVKVDQTFVLNDGAATMRVVGKGDFTGQFSFTPRFHIDWDIDGGFSGPYVDTFEVSAGGSLRASSRLDFDVTAAIVSGEADEVSLDGALPAFPDGGGWISKLLRESPPYAGPTIGPVPTTFRVYLYLDCRYAVKGNLNGYVSASVDIANAKIGASYSAEDDEFTPIASFPITASGEVVVNKGGAAIVECGLRPQIDWRFADLGGPYINGRSTVELTGSYNEVCPVQPQINTVPSDGIADLALASNFNVDVGGAVDLFVTELEIGPFTVFERRFSDIYKAQRTFARAGTKTCAGTCDDGVLSTGESDIDCSGPCGKCANGRICDVGEDCSSSVCSIGLRCVQNTCLDGFLNNGETGIDCGSAACQVGCGEGSNCGIDADCAPGFCGDLNGFRVCVSDSCADGRLNFTETSRDCGGACDAKCQNEFGCLVGADCASGVCGISNTCKADRCVDGRKNFDETDVDCGGPTCSTRCLRGCQIDGDCSQLDGGRICGTNNQCTVGCGDGRRSDGETDIDCGGVCTQGGDPRRCGVRAGCRADNDCLSGICNERTFQCVANACQDGELNNGESSADCGGPNCVTCGLQKTCSANSDCASRNCGVTGVCVSDQCHDGVANGNETDVDCGGSCLDRCPTQGGCDSGVDCKSGLCLGNICISDRCQDRVKNGNETGVDCGGSCTNDCAVGAGCLSGADCQTGICNETTRVCAADSCSDGVLNNDETDLDCGGSCAGCDAGAQCDGDLDCDSGVCNIETLRCAVDHCGSGLIDEDETDVDCGGSCGASCGFTQQCIDGGDCQSALCLADNTCAQDSCSNGVFDNGETGVDCGGSCLAGCGAGFGCDDPSDCASGFCQVGSNTCVDNHCIDGVRSGTETGLDCGGPTCSADCPLNGGCAVGSDCASGFCNIGGFCVASRCLDGIANGPETDVDCGGAIGGSGCATCRRGQGCTNTLDCEQSATTNVGDNSCLAGVCQAALPQTCEQLFRERGVRADGVYTINIFGGAGGNGTANVFCDMTRGGWTLAWMINSQFVGTANFGFQPLNIGRVFGQGFDTAGLAGDPRLGVFSHGVLPFMQIASGTPENLPFTTTQWVSYGTNGIENVERYRSDEIPLSLYRLRAQVPQNGYQLLGPKYFMCAGDAGFTDNGVGQVSQPPGVPNRCFNNGASPHFGGYEFSEDTFFSPGQGMYATGQFDFLGNAQNAPNNGEMSTAPRNVFGHQVIRYGNPGAVQTMWIK